MKYDISPALSHKDRVLERLRAAVDYDENDGWVSVAELVSEEVGGVNGTRRLRELRADGYEIQQRSEGRTAFYRLRIAEGPNPNSCAKCRKDGWIVMLDVLSQREFTCCAKCAYWFDSRSGYRRVEKVG